MGLKAPDLIWCMVHAPCLHDSRPDKDIFVFLHLVSFCKYHYMGTALSRRALHPECSLPLRGASALAMWLANAFQVRSCSRATPSASVGLTVGRSGAKPRHLMSVGCNQAAKHMFIQTTRALWAQAQLHQSIIGSYVRTVVGRLKNGMMYMNA